MLLKILIGGARAGPAVDHEPPADPDHAGGVARLSAGVAGHRHRGGGDARGRRDPGGDGLHLDRADPDRDRPVYGDLPDVVFALLGASRLLVVGADSATAAILAAGLLAIASPGVTPESPSCGSPMRSLIALVCGVLLLFARLFRLGFLGDFLSASVLIGFLTGVGIQVLSGQIPDMLGIPKGTGTWFEQQWAWIDVAPRHQPGPPSRSPPRTLVIILGFKRFVPKVPGAIVAVVLLDHRVGGHGRLAARRGRGRRRSPAGSRRSVCPQGITRGRRCSTSSGSPSPASS